MDKKRTTNKPPFWKQSKVLVSVVGLALFFTLYMVSQKFTSADMQVNAEHLLYSKVQQGPLTISVSGNGVLVPENIQWLAARVSGRVEQVVIKAGTKVMLGDVIAVLSNPELEQRAEETRWDYEALIAQVEALNVELESSLLQQKSQVLHAQFAYESADLQLTAETQLIASNTGVVSEINFKKTQMNVSQLKRSWQIQQQLYEKFALNMKAKIKAKNAELNKLAKVLQRAESRVAALSITAPMNGIVQESDLKSGQQIAIGGLVAKIADPKSLFAELQLSELNIGEVSLGQTAVIDTRNGTVAGEVIRIDPNVNNGNVQVDIKILQTLPKNARPDLSITGKINVSELENTLYVQRPAFVRANVSSSLYRLDDEGYARKVTVQLGQGSVNQIQVLSGLQAGDEIVLSDTSNWQTHNTVLLN
ncbi:MAG: efflux RND transporter periplasmic adaptor subunit [Colwelliaceae bacterium]|nr:efflux RND transporter periplasmic adaptor subunit [Colwelliaceae bacterium]